MSDEKNKDFRELAKSYKEALIFFAGDLSAGLDHYRKHATVFSVEVIEETRSPEEGAFYIDINLKVKWEAVFRPVKLFFAREFYITKGGKDEYGEYLKKIQLLKCKKYLNQTLEEIEGVFHAQVCNTLGGVRGQIIGM